MSHLRHGRPHRIRGWGLIKAPGARLAQRRYMRLIHHTLTVFDAADEDADLVIFEEILVGTQVSLAKRRREIVVRFPSDKFSVVLRTDKEFDVWSAAFTDGARVADDFYKLVTTRQLGAGAFSIVYFGFDRDNGDHVAVKVVDKTSCSRAELDYAETEARMMAYVQHPSIIKCRDIFDAPEAMHVVMEYMSGSTLEQRMLSMQPHERAFSETTAATIMSHILDALAYLEMERICHRDVKPDNILLSTLPNDAPWATSARLSDFGLAAFIDTDLDLIDIVGTPNYMAPEVVSRDEFDNERLGYGTPVDTWASGILMFWMLSGGSLPFDGESSDVILKAVRAAKLNLSAPPWTSISADAKSLIRSLLHPHPNTRLRSTAARTHPWLLRAHNVLPQASYARMYADKGKRRGMMSWRARFRGIVRAVMAVNLFMELVDEEVIAERKAVRSERLRRLAKSKKTNVGQKMQRAPERAPIGADGLGYNVGLIPSFTPKRRAKAGNSPSGMNRERGGGKVKTTRISEESGSSGSRTPSGEKKRSIERTSLGGKNSRKTSGSWSIMFKGRGIDGMSRESRDSN